MQETQLREEFHKLIDTVEDNDILEAEVFNRLVKKRELVGHCFGGYWECMDTYKDTQRLNDLWASGHAPWKAWP